VRLYSGGINRKTVVHISLGIKTQDPQAKRAGDMDQVVEHLPSKCEDLSSNFSTTKKKRILAIHSVIFNTMSYPTIYN
jgi:hypothetical protein